MKSAYKSKKGIFSKLFEFIRTYFVLLTFILTFVIYSYLDYVNPNIGLLTFLEHITQSIITSYIFYYLAIVLPNYNRKMHIKKLTSIAYFDFKIFIIETLVSHIEKSVSNIEALNDPKKFNEIFSQQDYHKIIDRLILDKRFMSIVYPKVKFLMHEIYHLLNAIEHTDSEAFTVLKSFLAKLHAFLHTHATVVDDDVEKLMDCFWQVFSATVDGDKKTQDLIVSAIDRL